MLKSSGLPILREFAGERSRIERNETIKTAKLWTFTRQAAYAEGEDIVLKIQVYDELRVQTHNFGTPCRNFATVFTFLSSASWLGYPR